MIEVSTYLKVGTLAFLMVFTILIWEILQHNQSDPVDAVEHHGNGRQGRYDHGGRALLSSEGSKYSAASKLGGDLIMCGASVKEAYNESPTHISGGKSVKWCKQMQENYEVILGRSWGHLPKNMQKIWDGSKCNELLKRGKIQSCDERYGWSFLNNWRKEFVRAVDGYSKIDCIEELKSSTFCRMRNVTVDYTKAPVAGGTRSFKGGTRSFKPGFVTAYGIAKQSSKEFEPKGVSGKLIRAGGPPKVAQCEVTEKRPTFIMSNDDIFNLGHYMNDIMAVWNMLMLANKGSKESVLVNMDGVRVRGPAGGNFHRIMNRDKPDDHGPYAAYYQSWFKDENLQRAIEISNDRKRVCYEELYFQPLPGVPWFWNDWGLQNACSMQSASPLYQSFNLFLRKQWAEKYGKESLPDPDTGDTVHVVIEVRTINMRKAIKKQSTGRHIKNLKALVAALKKIPNVRVTTQDFALLDFKEQVALSHSAGVFISMHGAGTTHIFHSAIGKPNCCALIELFPDKTLEFYTAQGYGNLARMLGLHHWRHVSSDRSTTDEGTIVDVDIITEQVKLAVDKVKKKPTCLNDVKDTSGRIFNEEF